MKTTIKKILSTLLVGIFVTNPFLVFAEELAVASEEVQSTGTATSTSVGLPDINFNFKLQGEEVFGTTTETTIFEIKLDEGDATTTTTTTATTTLNIKDFHFLLDLEAPAIEETRTVTIEIMSGEKEIYTREVSFNACSPSEFSEATSTFSAYCALRSAEIPVTWSALGDDLFLNSVFGDANDFGSNLYWLYFKNLSFGNTSLNKEILDSGNTLTLTYGTYPSRVTSATSTPFIGQSTTVSVSGFGFDESFNGVFLPLESAKVYLSTGEILESSTLGEVYFSPTTTAPVSIYTKKLGYATSTAIIINPKKEKKNIGLKVATLDNILFDGEVAFEACSSFEGQSENFYGFCALETTSLNPEWTFYSSYGNSAFLDSIGGVANAGDFSSYWSYMKNLTFGNDALNKDTFSSGDDLLLYHGATPTRISASHASTTGAGSVFLTVEQFGFDESFNAVWLPLSNADVYLGENIIATSSELGIYTFATTTLGNFSFKAKKATFVPSNSVSISVVEEETPTDETPGGGGGSSTKTLSIPDLFTYLNSKISGNGSFGSDLYTDWAAVAYGAYSGNESQKEKLRAFLRSDTLDGSLLTDFERRAMAMLALGMNPYTDGHVNYIEPIVNSFDGNQFGDSNEYNDDMFAIIVLRNSGYESSDSMIQKSADFIISTQNSNGSWSGVDITSAGAQALLLVGRNTEATRAINFIKSSQNNEGAFGGSTFSTSWALGALGGAGESITSIRTGGKNGLDYLGSKQQSDGGMEDVSSSESNRVWSSSYAVVGGLGLSWDSILNNVAKPVQSGGSTSGAATTTDTIIEEEVLGVGTTTAPVTLSPKETIEVLKKPFEEPVIATSTENYSVATTTSTTEEDGGQEAQLASLGSLKFGSSSWYIIAILFILGGIFYAKKNDN